MPNCGGQWKRYNPFKDKVAGSIQKMFSYCPSTRKSTTPGFDNVVYDNFELFKSVVDAELERRTVCVCVCVCVCVFVNNLPL